MNSLILYLYLPFPMLKILFPSPSNLITHLLYESQYDSDRASTTTSCRIIENNLNFFEVLFVLRVYILLGIYKCP